jgi:hypothetical protein
MQKKGAGGLRKSAAISHLWALREASNCQARINALMITEFAHGAFLQHPARFVEQAGGISRTHDISGYAPLRFLRFYFHDKLNWGGKCGNSKLKLQSSHLRLS